MSERINFFRWYSADLVFPPWAGLLSWAMPVPPSRGSRYDRRNR